ncbi:MAG: HDOD domain-containing protein [Synergistaceae bacterium]|nr:HDOD domain-containing protein [Synergistaceae bacterium]
MVLVAVDHLMVGMVLENDLVAFNGRFLLPSGASLTEKHIQTMKIWGVAEAAVTEDRNDDLPVETAPEISPEIFARGENLIAPLFLAKPEESPMKEIYGVALDRIVAALLRNGAPDVLQPLPPRRPGGEETDTDRVLTPADLVSREVRLASLPDVYYRIMEVINSARSSASQIAETVSKDTSLLTKLLKLVNSAFYGFPSKIETVSRAVAIIGTKELSTLALGIAAVQYFTDISPDYIDMKDFWRHSIACGVYARLLASEKLGVSEERLFVAGLLHDIGKLVLFRQVPRQARQALEYASSQRVSLAAAEREILGFDHTQLGAALLREWKIPSSLETCVRFHHSPHASQSILEATLLSAANSLAIAALQGRSGDPVVPEISSSLWKETGVSAAVFSTVVLQGDRQIADISSSFLGVGR